MKAESSRYRGQRPAALSGSDGSASGPITLWICNEKRLAGRAQSIMISRHWKGVAKFGEADKYIHHLKTDTFPKLLEIDGFISASILTRSVEQGTEFLIVTVWESIEAIKAFAGEKADVAVVPEVVQAMMIEYDRKVRHYEVAETYIPWS